MRGLAVLPHGTGKKLKVAVFATGQAAEEATAAGATYVGGDDLVDKIKGGMLDFDRCIATPAAMPLATKVARVLGPRGLMPNAKLGTVTDRVADAIRQLTSGVPYKTDKTGNVHAVVGKVSFSPEQLAANATALVQTVVANRPRGVKEPFILAAYMSSTMGQSVPIQPSSFFAGGEAEAAAAAAAAAGGGAWVWKEPVEPTDLSKVASKKLRRYLLAKRGLDPHAAPTPEPKPPAAAAAAKPKGKQPAAAAAA